MLAHSIQGKQKRDPPELIHLTFAEIRRLITCLTDRCPGSMATSCTGHTGDEDDNTRPASVTTYYADTALETGQPSAETALQY